MILSDLRISVRSLLKNPGFVFTAVVSLGLGIGAGAAAFSVIDSIRFRALPFRDADRLVVLSEIPTGETPSQMAQAAKCRGTCDVSYETFSRLLQVYPFHSIDRVAGYTSGGKALNTGEEPILVTGGVVSDNLFELLGVQPALGRTITPDDNRLGVPLVVLLSHDLWTQHFGSSRAILGQTIKLSDSRYTVIGVMPAGFDHEVGSQFWLPAVPTLDPSTKPSIRSLTVIARLAPGRTLAQFNGELATLDPKALASASARGATIRMRLEATPLRDRYTASTNSHDLIFGAVVACVLLIACTNLANLILVRALHQQREFAVRSALGARPGRLVRELLTQYAVIVVAATGVGLLFASWLLRMLHSVAVLSSLRPTGMEYRLDVRVVGFVLVLAVAALGLLGVVPARMVARTDVQRHIRDGAPTSTGSRWGSQAQRGFVVVQIASAVVLLVGAGLMVKTVLRLSRLDLGFDVAPLVQGTPSYPHPWRVKEKYVPVTRQLLFDLAQLPGVAAAAYRAEVPLGPRGTTAELSLEGQASPIPHDQAPEVGFAVSPSYFKTLGVALRKGREFTDQDTELGLPVAVVNEWAARRWWPGRDPIGQTIRIDSVPGQGVTVSVVGVAADNKAAQRNLLLAEDGPELYRPYEQMPSAFPSFYLATRGGPAALLRPVRQLLARSVPDRPVQAQLVSQQAADQLRAVRLNAIEIIGFAAVGLGLALVGIHGVLSYAVGRRTQEIGLRGALGASRGHIAATVLTDAGWLVLAGLAIGLPVAATATKLIGSVLYGTSPTDPEVYLIVAVGVAIVAFAASYLPARRAARVDPIVALRSS